MTGYRTLIYAAIVAVAGMLGHHLAPEVVNSCLDVIFAVVAVGIATMRWLTSTPLGLSTHPALADLANLLTAATAKGDAPIPAVPQLQPADAPASGGATITGPPMTLVDLATSISIALDTIQGVHAEMVTSLQAANDKVSAALPVAAPHPEPQLELIVDPQPQPHPVSDPQPEPQPAAAATAADLSPTAVAQGVVVNA